MTGTLRSPTTAKSSAVRIALQDARQALTHLLNLQAHTSLASGSQSDSQLDHIQILDPSGCSLVGRQQLGVQGDSSLLDLFREFWSRFGVPDRAGQACQPKISASAAEPTRRRDLQSLR